MKKIGILFLTLGMVARSGAQDASQFVAYLHGGNEAPPNNSAYSEVGYFVLQGNALSYLISVPFPPFSNFLPTDAGIYGPAGRGTNGDLIFDWPTFDIEIAVPYPGGTIRYSGSSNLSAEELAQVSAGLWYVNIKTTNFPNGELRGQICPQTPESDCDGDGIANANDLCPDTLPGTVTDANGCSIEQLCPCSGPWRNHREYVKAVREQAFRFWKEGRIGTAEREWIVRQAERSDCGKPVPPIRAQK